LRPGAITVFIIDREFDKAAGFALAGAIFTFFGFIHGEAIQVGSFQARDDVDIDSGVRRSVDGGSEPSDEDEIHAVLHKHTQQLDRAERSLCLRHGAV